MKTFFISAVCVVITSFIAGLIGYKIFQHYSTQIRYLTFIEDLIQNKTDNLILRLSSDFWFNAFKSRADAKTINLVLRRIGHAVYSSHSFDNRNHIIGLAMGKLSTINKKCQTRAIQYCTSMAISTNNPACISALLDENPNIPGRKFVSVIKQLNGKAREELIHRLQDDPATKKILVLL